MTDPPRLIEVAFPLKQASLDSVHEKNVRHGHISTLHIWPARRPLAACRAALIATLLPDPGTPEERRALCERIGGKVIKVARRKTLPDGRSEERLVEETVGGILHWGRESEYRADLDYFRQEIRKVYGGRAPRVFDPFAGGGAPSLEAMRLGCAATAMDVNPVAWLILKCTLEYPQSLSGRKRRLPDFALRDRDFMEAFFTAQGFRKLQIATFLKALGLVERNPAPPLTGLGGYQIEPAFLQADLAWHVRAWGRHIQAEACRDLAPLYPVYANFEPSKQGGPPWDRRPPRLVPLRDDGTPDTTILNEEFDKRPSSFTPGKAWLDDPICPRWIAKPTVAYLWARTVRCRNCRATIPLLKTRWLARGKHRVLLTIEADQERREIRYGVQVDVPAVGGNNAMRREHDRRVGQGTMSRSGAWCPCCGRPGSVAMSMEDIQAAGQRGELGEEMVAAAVEGRQHKEFRPILNEDHAAWQASREMLIGLQARDTVGALTERIDPRRPSPNARGLAGLTKYGIVSFDGVFNTRQQAALFYLTQQNRHLPKRLHGEGYEPVWADAVADILALVLSKLADYNSKGCTWNIGRQGIGHTFARFALPMTSDYAESNPIGDMTGGLTGAVEWIASCVDGLQFTPEAPVRIELGSADEAEGGPYDAVVTDPPYYDAIPYADISEFFYIWLRRALGERHPLVFGNEVVDRSREIVQHAGRLDGDNERARALYESRMAQAFERWHPTLADDGRLVVVFAHKHPAAWETLVAAIVTAGFVVDASWPIQTERQARSTALASAALASSVWLVCKKRPRNARAGWDNHVLTEMRTRINQRLRDFWDAGVRGPDFVWAATGPALEAYSKHPMVKKADTPGELMTVSEFLRSVRRMVVDFVIGRVLSETTHGDIDPEAAAGLDDVTTYYLLHRYDFKLEDAPAGACILYAVSCNLSESELADRHDILARTGGTSDEAELGTDDDDGAATEDDEEGTGSTFKLKGWKQRTAVGVGGGPGERPVPLIDQIHRLMHLWRAGDQAKVDQYLDDRRLRRSQLFQHVLQALIELAPEASEERSILEALMNHVRARGVAAPTTGVFEFPTQGSGDDDT